MLYARVSEDGTVLKFPISEEGLRSLLQNIVLPRVITPDVLEGTGFVMVPLHPDAVVPTNTKDKMVNLAEAVRAPDGTYTRRYELLDVPEYQKADRLSRKWQDVRTERFKRINAVQWRVDRWERETRLGLTPTESIEKLDKYMQALCDITKTDDPFTIVWPTLE